VMIECWTVGFRYNDRLGCNAVDMASGTASEQDGLQTPEAGQIIAQLLLVEDSSACDDRIIKERTLLRATIERPLISQTSS
jgi:hypothetical protein